MLIDGLLHVFNAALQWFLSIRPPWSWTLDSTPSTVVQQALYWDWCLPIHECIADMVIAITAFLAMVGTKWAIKLCDWIADVIP